MKELILGNPVLSYRFPIWLDFEDYNEKELFEIGMNLIKNRGFNIDKKAEDEFKSTIHDFCKMENLSVKNAIMITKLLDKIVRAQSIRVYKERASSKEVNTINSTDIIQSKEKFVSENTLDKRENIDICNECNVPIKERNNDTSIQVNNYDCINIINELLKLKNLLELNLINQDEFNKLKNELIR